MSTLREALRDLSDDVFFDLLEGDDAYLLVIDVPGLDADSCTYSIADGSVSIEGVRAKAHSEGYEYIEENRSREFDLDVPLPADVVDSNPELSIERGVLELTIPKRPEASETTIDVVDGER